MTDLGSYLITAWAILIFCDLFLIAVLLHDLIDSRRPVPAPEQTEPPGVV